MPVVWLWMFLAGLGVGPTFSVLTIVIQNAVPFRAARRGDLEPDVLPADRRYGLARVRGHHLRHVVPGRARAAAQRGRRARPADPGDAARRGGSTSGQLTGVGDLAATPRQGRPARVPAVHRRTSSRASTGHSASRPPRRSGSVSSARSSLRSPQWRSRRSRSARRTRRRSRPRRSPRAPRRRASPNRLRQHRCRRLTLAPPLARRPRWTRPGSSFIRGSSIRGHGPEARSIPRPPPGARYDRDPDPGVRGRPRRRRAAAGCHAPGEPRRSRHPARRTRRTASSRPTTAART